MHRFLITLVLSLMPVAALSDVTCAELQKAFKVPPPISDGAATNSNNPGRCSPAAMQMFEINGTAFDAAVPVDDLSLLYGTWLGDRVLSYLLGHVVPGQEVLVIGPGKDDSVLSIKQYWMKASTPHWQEPVWSDDGRYVGWVAEASLQRMKDGRFHDPTFGENVRYSGLMLEFERAHDLHTKVEMNHFEAPLALRLDGDVMVLDGLRRAPVSRREITYARSYTRIGPDAADLALATVLTLELSQSRNFDCLTHQFSEGAGPFFAALAPNTMSQFVEVIRKRLVNNNTRLKLSLALETATDDDSRAALMAKMRSESDVFLAQMNDPVAGPMLVRLAEASNTFCPDFF